MIRRMTRADTAAVVYMMERFYASDAVMTNGSAEIFQNDVENCVNDSPYLDGYVFEENFKIQGYAMVAKSFSTEFGKSCIWIEDLFIESTYRGEGIGSQFLCFIDKQYPDAIFRLEVEPENKRAIRVYKNNDFQEIPYLEMIRR